MTTAGLDRSSLEPMLVDLRPRLHRYCARMVGSVVDGEDVVQEALLKAVRAADGSVELEHAGAWLFRIAHNAARDHLRRTRREDLRLAAADVAQVEDPAGRADARVAAAAGLRAFMQLPSAHRGPVILVDVLGLSLREACEVTGATPAAVKAQLHRGRSRLRRLGALQDDPPPNLSAEEERLLRRYVELFNARDFDAVRELIAEDVRLEVVTRTRLSGKGPASTYYGNYERAADWMLSAGFVEERPAILSRDPADPGGAVRSFMLLEWSGGRVASIRDFRYAPYCMEGAEIRSVDA